MEDSESKKRPNELSNDADNDPPAMKKARLKSAQGDHMEESDDDEEEEEDLFASSPPPPRPRTQQVEQRQASLSKFVRRMLDPDRKPRGLIEPPKVIPLNDEFLQAFGKREKEFDEQTGRTSDFDQTIPDDNGSNNENDLIDASVQQQAKDQAKKEDRNSRKLKISNLKYTTTEAHLREECLNYGPVEEIIMPMDETKSELNIGRAYIVFETSQDAQECFDQQLVDGGNLHGRPIKVTWAGEPNRGGGGGGGGGKGDEKRYWEKDISTKCRRCGEVGHIEAECNNQSKANICPLCAKADDHEMRQCSLNRICFNCGIPGHINRECTVRRGTIPPRMICTLCCGSGHTKFQCQRSISNITGINASICLVCHQRGHFMCKEQKWFFGLNGIFCYNCGGKGHVGNQCQRPTFDDLNRSDGWTLKEVERGQEYKLADEMESERAEQQRKERERQQKRHEERERQRNRYRERDRARSAPPQRPGGDYYNDFTGGGGSYGGQYNNNNNSSSSSRGGGGGRGGEYRYTIDDNDNNNNNNNNRNNNNRGYRNTNNNRQSSGGNRQSSGGNRQSSGGRRRGYR